MRTVDMNALEYFPAGHAVADTRLVENVPAGAQVHADDLTALLYWPLGHREQDDDPNPE